MHLYRLGKLNLFPLYPFRLIRSPLYFNIGPSIMVFRIEIIIFIPWHFICVSNLAINIDPKYAKARVRRAKAHEARDEIMPCLKGKCLCPSDKMYLVQSGLL